VFLLSKISVSRNSTANVPVRFASELNYGYDEAKLRETMEEEGDPSAGLMARLRAAGEKDMILQRNMREKNMEKRKLSYSLVIFAISHPPRNRPKGIRLGLLHPLSKPGLTL
jgi:hypothetical protein